MLQYRVGDEQNYRAVPMRYLRFGLYLASVPLFYGEKVAYCFSEEMPTGSISTQEQTIENDALFLNEGDGEGHDDMFFAVNNAIIYQHMFKHEQAEKIVNELVKNVRSVRSGLIK